MGAALAFSAWLGLEALQGGPSIGGRVLDAQTGDPVAGATIVVEGRTAAAAGPDGVFSAPAGPARRVDVLVTAVGYAFVTRRDAGIDARRPGFRARSGTGAPVDPSPRRDCRRANHTRTGAADAAGHPGSRAGRPEPDRAAHRVRHRTSEAGRPGSRAARSEQSAADRV